MPVRLLILLSVSCALTGCARNSWQCVATVLGKPIYAADVTPTREEMRSIRDPDATPEQRFREERRARITSRIIRPLEARYVRERDLRPTEDEVEQFVRSSQARNEEIERKVAADLEAQRGRLATATTPQEQADASARVEALEVLGSLMREAAERADSGGVNDGMDWAEADARELAGVWVATWKFHRALNHEFGGAVVWRDTGPEPVGAYRKWLEGLERNGDFTITDPGLRELFWSYWRRDADVVMDPDVDAFAIPWWLENDDSAADVRGAVQSSR
jgi:hypothetical protein